MAEPQQARDDLSANWDGDLDELVGLEDRLREPSAADRVFADRAEAFAAGHALAIEAARRAHVALSKGHVVADRPAGLIEANTLIAARLDPFGAAQWEIACELELGNGSRVPVVIDCTTATELGQALIAQANRYSPRSEPHPSIARNAPLRQCAGMSLEGATHTMTTWAISGSR